MVWAIGIILFLIWLIMAEHWIILLLIVALVIGVLWLLSNGGW